jgi:hypothetical protein
MARTHNGAHTQVRPYRVAAMTNGVPTPVWADRMVPKWYGQAYVSAPQNDGQW